MLTVKQWSEKYMKYIDGSYDDVPEKVILQMGASLGKTESTIFHIAYTLEQITRIRRAKNRKSYMALKNMNMNKRKYRKLRKTLSEITV